jgi:hypothetical protein
VNNSLPSLLPKLKDNEWSGITSLTCNNGTEDDILVTNKAKVTDNSIAKLPFPKDKQQELKQSTAHS